MDTVATYLPPIIAFAAMFIGLLGPGRASDRTGIKAITPFGWTSCAVGAASLLVSLYIQYRKDEDLAAALQSRLQMRAVVTRELKLGVESLRSVLRYAALMPHFTTSQTVQTFPDDLPYPKYRISRLARDIDLRSPEVIGVLERLYVSPSARMKAPVIPSAMPFGTHVAKPCMSVLVDESRAAASRIESAVQKYAAVALTPEVISAGSELATSPFLIHLMSLRESWANRSEMEDSTSPRSLNFRFIGSGLSGSHKQQYLQLLDRIDRMSSLLDGIPDTRQ